MKEALAGSGTLNDQVQDFYYEQFWGRFLGDEIQDQSVAEELFDTAVNMGIDRAVRFLQESLNYLNRNEVLFPDLVEDGLIGKKTLEGLNLIIRAGDVPVLLKVLNVLQGRHYLDFMRRSLEQEQFARGWLSRVSV